MPPRIKTEEERQLLQKTILDEAERMFIAEGYAATSLRKLARRVGYSVGTIYLYFASKDLLFYAVQARAFAAFYHYLQPLQEIENPLERIRKMGDRYLSFALQHSEYYDLMFIHDAPMNAVKESEGWKLGMHTFDILQHTVEQCMEQKYFAPNDAETTAFMIWSTVHGMVSLNIRERLKRHLPNETIVMMNNAQRMLIDHILVTYKS